MTKYILYRCSAYGMNAWLLKDDKQLKEWLSDGSIIEEDEIYEVSKKYIVKLTKELELVQE